jgi:predicted amidohydrolase YtcJ
MFADLVVLSEDIVEGGMAALERAHVDMTIVDGEVAYRRP